MPYRQLAILAQVVLFVLCALFGLGLWHGAQQRQAEALENYARRGDAALRQSETARQNQALAVGTMFAADPEVRSALQQIDALTRQGKAPTDPAMVRQLAGLRAQVTQQWQSLREPDGLYGLARLNFVVASGRLVVLRMDHDEGAPLPAVTSPRALVALALDGQRPTAGYEIGPTFAGIRGVVPVYAPDSAKPIPVGALDIGLQPQPQLAQLDRQFNAAFALVLATPAASGMLPAYREAIGKLLPNGCDCILVASSRNEFRAWLNAHTLPALDGLASRSDLLRYNGRLYQLLQLPLRPFSRQPAIVPPRVGRVLVWHDVTEPLGHIRRGVLLSLAATLAAYLVAAFALAWLLRRAQLNWTQRIDQQVALLGREEARLQTLIDATPDLIAFRSRRGHWFGANQTARRLLGMRPAGSPPPVEAPLESLPPSSARHDLEDAVDAAWDHAGFIRQDLSLRDPQGHKLVLDLITVPSETALGPETVLVVIGRDVTRERSATSSIAALSRRHEQILMCAADGIYGVDNAGRVSFINPSALRSLGYERTELVGAVSHALIHHHHADDHPYPVEECPISRTLADGLTRSGEDWFLRKDGSGFPVHMTVAAVMDGERPQGVVVIFQDITEPKRRENELHRLASVDALTGCFNRRVFLERLQTELARVRRHGRGGVVLMLDLDHFKAINDHHGHAAGDLVLQSFARCIAGGLRQRVDVFGRLGGEEFAILLPETPHAGGLELAERLRRQVEEMDVQGPNGPIRVTVSIGLADFDTGDQRPEDPLGRADHALYAAKEAGRNRVSAGPAAPRAEALTTT